MRNRAGISRDKKDARECQLSPLKLHRAEDNSAQTVFLSSSHTPVGTVSVCVCVGKIFQVKHKYDLLPPTKHSRWMYGATWSGGRSAVSIFNCLTGSCIGIRGQCVLLKSAQCKSKLL